MAGTDPERTILKRNFSIIELQKNSSRQNTMNDEQKTTAQLLDEVAALRKRVGELEMLNEQYRLAESAYKQIEKEQDQAKQMLQLILDTIPQRVFWKDRNYSFIGCNKPFAQDAGLKDPGEIVGKNDFELGWKDVAQLYRDDDREVMETDTPKLNFEEPQIAPDGSPLWLRTNKVPLHDQKGNVIGILGTYQDITKLKHAEEELRYERNLLRTVIDNLPDAIYVKDTKCRKTVANKEDVHLMGGRSEAEVLGKTDFDFYPPDVAEKFIAIDRSVLETGQPVLHNEASFKNNDGSERWLLTSKIPLKDEQGNIVGLVGIGRDITLQKKAQESMQHERYILRTLIDNLPDAIFIKDEHCRKIIANVADVHNVGLQSESDVLGKDDFMLFPKEIAERFYEDDKAVLQTGQPVLNREEYFLEKNGQKRWLLTSKLPLRDERDRIIGLVGIGRDITKRKLAEESLEQERNLLRTLIDNLPDMIFFKDVDGRYVLDNQSHLRSLGLKNQEDILGKRTYDFNPPELAQSYSEDELQVIQTKKELLDKEELAVHKDTGEQRWHLTSRVPLIDSQGNVTGIVGIARDITEHKRAEAERERLIKELQTALADIKVLSGLVPICANCKKIRDDKGYWNQLEGYIQEHSQARFSHGVCPDCMQKLYPNFVPKKKE
jgi:PAS domain S-box-containing protein